MLRPLLLGTLLALATPLIGSAQQVYITSNSRSADMFLLLPPGNYVLNAKVTVTNTDGDAQYAECNLNTYQTAEPVHVFVTVPNFFPLPLSGTTQQLDQTDIRIPGQNTGGNGVNYQQSVALQGAFASPVNDATVSNTVFTVHCHGFAAAGSQAVLTAIAVKPPTGEPDPETRFGGTGYRIF